ncbi:MAG: hypothetical protein KAS77_03080, partial [Thermoplasmata archaeon]|nr:hypothetical protein [Thermoplasmata archaeon]
WLLYLLPLVIVIVIALAYYWAKKSGERDIREYEGAPDDDDDDDDEEEEPDLEDMDLEGLEARKAELVGKIKQVQKEHDEGIVGNEELDVRLKVYKDEAVLVMKQIDRYEDD